MNSDDSNLHFVTSTEAVDKINRTFYERFPFPPPPLTLSLLSDTTLEIKMLNQSIGSWHHARLPPNMRVWIAGCGRNQACLTALRYPNATIVASDLSTQSLASSEAMADSLGLRNVEFRHESINKVDYRDEFDYVLCTGVVHHNADPAETLRSLARALKPTGILELMVYNRYHRLVTTAFQKAIRLLGRGKPFDQELRIARCLINDLGFDNRLSKSVEENRRIPEAEFADAFLQPVEYSFTVESLNAMVTDCGLQLLTPTVSQFDKARKTFLWDLEFDDAELAAEYEALSDIERWQVSNHLKMEKSPMLWFYCGRIDSEQSRPSEKELCREFLRGRFAPARCDRRMYLRTEHAGYEISPRVLDYPGLHPDPICRKIVERFHSVGSSQMLDVLGKLGVHTGFVMLNRLRLSLTTPEYPFLVCVK